ncbi:hypothetical protein KR222_010182 [Zaprionus bogoriensis]|nr:hypothetical protein KR222_010182 [Zaprionus bogoriensis]
MQPPSAAAALLWLCLLWTPANSIKIGLPQDEQQSTPTTTTAAATTTTTTAATTTTEVTATTTNPESTASAMPESLSTPAQTFPPRRTPRKPSTTAATKEAAATLPPTRATNSSAAPSTAKPRRDYQFYYCNCDLQAEACETNCCCDRDCQPEELQVFDCLRSAAAPQLQARLEDFQYTHGLPTCQLHDGWLCVFRSNTRPEREQLLGNNFDAAQYNKWPEQQLGALSQLTPSSQSPTAHYKFGQPLQLWQPETKQLSHLELPVAFASGNCQLKQALKHLEPLRSSCLLPDVVQLQHQIGELINLTNSQQLLARPRDTLLDQEQAQEQQDVPVINIEVCQRLLADQSRNVCFDRETDSQWDLLVDKVELRILHNFTHILSARLLLWETSAQQDAFEPLWLSYEVAYKSIKDAQVMPGSGPLGYVLGAPLLFTMLQAQNNSVVQEQQKQLHNSTTFWLTLCQGSGDKNHAVGFGVDLTKQCQLQHTPPDLGNHSDYCRQLQAKIWRHLFPQNCSRLADLGQVFVSQLGRPEASKWLPLQLSFAEGQQVPPVQGVYNEEQQSLSCRNVFLGVSYEFFTAELTLLEGRVPHQPVVQHARLVLGQRHDLEFNAGEQQVELPLTATVMFFRQHEKKLNTANAASLILASSGMLAAALFLDFLI